MKANWNTGRGRRSSVKPKDALFMMLTVLKNAGHWYFVGRLLKIKGPTFERLVISEIIFSWELFFNVVVRKTDNRFTISKISSDQTLFKKFLCALYATDVTFQQ